MWKRVIFLPRDVVGLIHVFLLSNIIQFNDIILDYLILFWFSHFQVWTIQPILEWRWCTYTNVMWLELVLHFDIPTMLSPCSASYFDDVSANLQYLSLHSSQICIPITDQNNALVTTGAAPISAHTISQDNIVYAFLIIMLAIIETNLHYEGFVPKFLLHIDELGATNTSNNLT
mgnify:CR=1 FL=1